MRIRQYVHFALYSEQMPADEMARLLAMAPDETDVRASRSVYPPRPAAHAWKMVCGHRGLTVDQQIAVIVSRLEPVAADVARLARHLAAAAGGTGGARVQVVRYFNDPAGEDTPGWRLSPALVDFLHATGADLETVEYG